VTDSNRRDFLRAFGRRAARDAREVAQVAAPVLRATSPLVTANALRSLAGPADELATLARAEGLGARLDELRALARPSVRLTRVVEDPASAAAWLDVVGAEQLLYQDAPMMLLAQVSLASPALSGTWLRGDGWLVVFVDGAGTASVVRLDAPAALPPTVEAMELTAEVALPDLDSGAVQALGLSDEERAAYVGVHDGLADAADHHLLGYADDDAPDLGEGDWELLVQVRICPTEDVFVWVANGDLDRAVAVIR
jgi:hypothetical protein